MASHTVIQYLDEYCDSCVVYLVSEVSCEVIVLPGEVLVIQLGQTGPQDVFATEEWVMREDKSRDINIKLVVSLRVCCTSNVQICIFGFECLGDRTTSSITQGSGGIMIPMKYDSALV